MADPNRLCYLAVRKGKVIAQAYTVMFNPEQLNAVANLPTETAHATPA
jgi:hypothetical protein